MEEDVLASEIRLTFKRYSGNSNTKDYEAGWLSTVDEAQHPLAENESSRKSITIQIQMRNPHPLH